MSSNSAPQNASVQNTAGWRIACVVAYLVMIVVNALANALPLFGRSTGEVSAAYPTLFTPAPYTFSVWGVIYLLLAGFVVCQALPRYSDNPRLAVARPLFVLSCLLNAAWLVSWHALAITVSEVLMLALLVTLIVLYLRVNAWRAPASGGERWYLDLPFAVYLGWISVATIANTAIFLVSLGVDGGSSAPLLTIVMVAAAALLGLLASATRRDWGYTLVIAWALGGVAAARSSEAADSAGIVTAALIAAGLMVATALVAGISLSRAPKNPNKEYSATRL